MRSSILVIICGCLLSGCLINWQPSDYASNNKEQYLDAKNGQDLTIPPNLTARNLSDFYVLPNQNRDSKVAIEPPAA